MTKLLLLTTILGFIGCVTDGTETTGTPVASYASRTGTTIEIYGEGDTAFSVGELADRAHSQLALNAADAKTLSPTQIFQATSDAAVPAAITALTEKLVQSGREFPTTNPVAHVLEPAAFDNCTASTFELTWCHLGDGDPVTWCLPNQTKGNDKDMKQVSSSEAAVCVKSGTITTHVTNGDGGDHEKALGAGQYYAYFFNAGFLQTTWLDYDVSGVTGTYQFAGEAND
jgi:hypothetical protein